MDQNKQKALDAALGQIERQFGKGSVMKLGEAAREAIPAISTGSLGLDIALGVGGLPKGRIVEIYGPESSGKTTMTLQVIAEAQKSGGTAAFIDAEHALDPMYAEKLGVQMDDLIMSQPDTGEQALEVAEMLVRSGAVDVLVVDSVAALPPKAEIEGDANFTAGSTPINRDSFSESDYGLIDRYFIAFLGIALALGRQSSMPIIKWICVIFIEFIRGVPLITLLFVASVMLAYFFPPDSTVDLFLRVVIMITMFSSAYIAEVIRGGLAALPKGQNEAADSLGLDYAQAIRLIILPQALKISIPGIVNVAVGLFKDTTLVSVISMFDLVGMIRGPILASTEWNGVYWELWGFAVFVFFIVCFSISKYSQWLELQLATDHL